MLLAGSTMCRSAHRHPLRPTIELTAAGVIAILDGLDRTVAKVRHWHHQAITARKARPARSARDDRGRPNYKRQSQKSSTRSTVIHALRRQGGNPALVSSAATPESSKTTRSVGDSRIRGAPRLRSSAASGSTSGRRLVPPSPSGPDHRDGCGRRRSAPKPPAAMAKAEGHRRPKPATPRTYTADLLDSSNFFPSWGYRVSTADLRAGTSA
jgi:hypothetical protein